MDWDDLRYVLAISRRRTLSLAADTLGVSHTTVGRRLRALEEALGVRLFDRTEDAYTPTAAGRDVLEVAERLESDLLALEGRVLGRDTKLEGKLRVTTMDLLFARYGGSFASFAALHPSVELTVTSSDDLVSLTRREADVALRLTNSPPDYLVGRRIGRVEFAVYASRALAERVGPGAAYADHPWLHWDERLDMRWLDEWLATHAHGARIAMRLGVSSPVLTQAVVAGIGVHFLPTVEADADPSLVRIGPIHPEFTRDVWLLTLQDLRSTRRVRAFLDHFAELTPGRAPRGGSPAGG